MAPRAWLILALIASGACAAPAAEAAVYAIVGERTDAVTVMDPAAIEVTPDAASRRRAYSVTVQKTLTAEGPQQPGYVRTLNEYDCAARMIRWKSFSVYSRFGDLVIHKDNADETWGPTPPGSEADASTRLVCDHANSWGAVAAPSLSQLVISLMQAWDEAAPPPTPAPSVTPPTPPKKPVAKTPAKVPPV